MHQFYVIFIPSCLLSEVNFKKRQEKAKLDIWFDMQDFLEYIWTFIYENLNQVAIFTVIMVRVDKTIQDCKHNFMETLYNSVKILICI